MLDPVRHGPLLAACALAFPAWAQDGPAGESARSPRSEPLDDLPGVEAAGGGFFPAETSPILVIGIREDDADAHRLASPTPLIEMPQERVQRLGMVPSGQAMRGFPMLTVSGPPGYANDVRFRGLRQGYTQVLIDGEPVPGGTRERQFQVDRLPTTLIDCIALQPIAPVSLPQEGIAGSVDIRLREIPDTMQTSALIRGGLVRERPVYGGALAHGGTSGDWGWLVAGSADRLERWTPQEIVTSNPAGIMTARQEEEARSSYDEYNLTPRLRWARDGVAIRLDPFLLSKTEFKTREIDQLNGAWVLARHDTVDEERRHRVYRGKGSVTVPVTEDVALTAGALWQASEEDRQTLTEQYDPTGILTAHTRDTLASDERRTQGLVHLEAVPWTGHRVSAGIVGGAERRLDSAESLNLLTGLPVVPKPSGSRNDLAGWFCSAYLADSFVVAERHVFTPGLRMEWRRLEIDNDAGDTSTARHVEPLPSLHYVWHATDDTGVRASVARLIRWPDFNSLSSIVEPGNPNTVNTPDIAGNPDLDPERATAVEVGAETRSPDAWCFGVNLFYRHIRGVVERTTELEGTRWVQRPGNAGNAHFCGGTLDGRVHMSEIGLTGFWLYANGTRLWSSMVDAVTDDPRTLREMPDWLANAGLDCRYPPWGVLVGAGYSYNSGYDNTEPQDFNNRRAHATEEPTSFLDAYIAKTLGPASLLRLTVQNLFRTRKHRRAVVYNADGTVNQVQTRTEHSPLAVTLALEVDF